MVRHLTLDIMVVRSITTCSNEMFSFPRFGNKTMRDVGFRHLARNVSKVGWQVVECF